MSVAVPVTELNRLREMELKYQVLLVHVQTHCHLSYEACLHNDVESDFLDDSDHDEKTSGNKIIR